MANRTRPKAVVPAATAPPDIYHHILRHIRSRFDYAHLAVTNRSAFCAASQKSLLRAWFTRYMREGWFYLVDEYPRQKKDTRFRQVTEDVADVLGYSFRIAVRMHSLFPSSFEGPDVGFEAAVHDGLSTAGAGCIIDYLQTLPIKTINRLLQFCAIPSRILAPCHEKVHERFFEGDQMNMRHCGRTMILRPIVKTKMTPFEMNDQLLVVSYRRSENTHEDCVRYRALDSGRRMWDGMVWWKVHLPGGRGTLTDDSRFRSVFKAERVRIPSSRETMRRARVAWVFYGCVLQCDVGDGLYAGTEVDRIDFWMDENNDGYLEIAEGPTLKLKMYDITWAHAHSSRSRYPHLPSPPLRGSRRRSRSPTFSETSQSSLSSSYS
ncbi:hypothetical protein HK104_010157 [Borealophlyctis nickersoniae]|nr:hypothetical protein HK104_010157 [Borealophlyctis nickersoniae]